jgi:hypothetical protein
MNRKKKYISPTLKQYSFQVETGFFASLFLRSFDNDTDFDDCGMEKWDWDDDNPNNLGGNNFTDWNL